MTSLSQKILKESFILEAIKPESTLSVNVLFSVYLSFLFRTFLSFLQVILYCVKL